MLYSGVSKVNSFLIDPKKSGILCSVAETELIKRGLLNAGVLQTIRQ